VYLERPDMAALDAIGLVKANVNDGVQVVVRIPTWPRAVFRAAVARDGVLVRIPVRVFRKSPSAERDVVQTGLRAGNRPVLDAQLLSAVEARVTAARGGGTSHRL
jgi:hypothetical protein